MGMIASSPEQERLMRLAAEEVNRMLSFYEEKTPDRSNEERMALSALAVAMNGLKDRSKLAALEKESGELEAELDKYLAGIDTK